MTQNTNRLILTDPLLKNKFKCFLIPNCSISKPRSWPGNWISNGAHTCLKCLRPWFQSPAQPLIPQQQQYLSWVQLMERTLWRSNSEEKLFRTLVYEHCLLLLTNSHKVEIFMDSQTRHNRWLCSWDSRKNPCAEWIATISFLQVPNFYLETDAIEYECQPFQQPFPSSWVWLFLFGTHQGIDALFILTNWCQDTVLLQLV